MTTRPADRSCARASRPMLLAAILLATGCKGEGEGFVVVVNPGGLPPVAPPVPRPAPSPTPPRGEVTVAFSFRRDATPWQAVFADYPVEREALLWTRAGSARLPRELGTDNAFLLSGDGNPGGLFSGVWRRVDGLRPYTSYRVEFALTIASNLALGCTAPAGEAQIVKAGASGIVPEPTRMGIVRLPLDKGSHTGNGRNMVAAGDLTVPELRTCTPANRFHAKVLSSRGRGPVVATDSVGRLWVIVGVDSQHDGRFSYYIVDGEFALTPA